MRNLLADLPVFFRCTGDFFNRPNRNQFMSVNLPQDPSPHPGPQPTPAPTPAPEPLPPNPPEPKI
jgi:hypothetical protein